MATKVKEQTLTVRQLALVFAVTEMTIYNWRKDMVRKAPLPKRCTPTAISKWARANDQPIHIQPEKVLTRFPATKPGPKPSATKPTLKRSGAGKLTSVRQTRGGSGRIVAA